MGGVSVMDERSDERNILSPVRFPRLSRGFWLGVLVGLCLTLIPAAMTSNLFQ